MRFLFLSIFLCCCYPFSHAQLSLTDTTGEERSFSSVTNEEKITGYYKNGSRQYEGYKNKKNLYGPWQSWYSNGQLLDSGFLKKGIPDGKWVTRYKSGAPQFVRTYSAEKWQQFQNEKRLYHPKRVSMPITKFYHEHKLKAETYITAINTFCAGQNCARRNKEDFSQKIKNNNEEEHYHPLYENGLLHGDFLNYFPDGTLKDSGFYRNGLPEDLWIKWTDDRQFYWQGHYRHGVKNKEWKLYTANDKLVSIVNFREGKFLWRKDMKEGVEMGEEELSGF